MEICQRFAEIQVFSQSHMARRVDRYLNILEPEGVDDYIMCRKCHSLHNEHPIPFHCTYQRYTNHKQARMNARCGHILFTTSYVPN